MAQRNRGVVPSSIDLGEGVWYHLSCVTGDRGGYGRNALGEILKLDEHGKRARKSPFWNRPEARSFVLPSSFIVGSFAPECRGLRTVF